MNENKVKEQAENAEIREKKVGRTIKCFEYGQDKFEFSKLEWPQDGISFMKSKACLLQFNFIFTFLSCIE